MDSSAFSSSSTSKLSVFDVSIGDPVKVASKCSIIFFVSKNHCSLIILVVNGQPNELFYHFIQYRISLNKLNGVFLTILLLGLTHSIFFQFNWNLQSFQFLLAVCSFLLILSFFYCGFLLSVCFLICGIPLTIFFIYQ